MVFRQVIHDDLGCASYLVGDEDAGVAAVVDPKYDVADYLELARYFGVRIEHVLETHEHADHRSGHGRLAAATGAAVHIHERALAEYEHEPFSDGWELALGSVRVRALHTPGHRPEHCAFVLCDGSRSDEPWAVLSGDSLFVGDVARPDLAVDPADGVADVFDSLHERLLALPDHCELWPGHLGGSLCGGPGMDMKVASTIGYERLRQPLLQLSKRDFATAVLSALRPQPPNFGAIVDANRRAGDEHAADARRLAPLEVERRARAGGLVVDVRTEIEFDEAHVPGAVSITALRAGFGTKLAWLAPAGGDVVIVGRDDHEALRAVALAAAVGVGGALGYLDGGMTAWRQQAFAVQATPRLSVEALHERWASDRDVLQVLDVRERGEWEAGHVPGSVHVAYHDLHAVPAGLDGNRAVAVICASGQRAAVGASLLQRHGMRDVVHVVDGGVPLWSRRGWPIEGPAGPAA